MRLFVPIAATVVAVAAPCAAQRIVEVPAGEVDVAKPEDLYARPPGRWHLARELWRGDEPCTETQCEAGYTSGDLAVSAERNGPSVAITAAWRGCASTAYSQLDIGETASKGERRKIAKQVERVVKGLGKTCKAEMPEVAPLTADWLFPATAPADS
ncbi:MAG TPA: hypothetical protein VFS49_04770 [Croceibacterium sp.]|nr:hypothetical protein [Croceibacterium sp.]